MTESTPHLSATKQALQAIQSLQKRISELEHSNHEPIAVVGLACHFPGDLDSPETFWKALLEGKDLITEIPSDRWNVDDFYDPSPDQPGKMYTKFGAFLRDIDQFDASFFGISPREAHSMDPHQRLLLQTVWEAFESGGFDLNDLYGQKVGVYVGISNFEYGAHLIWPQDKRKITAYSGTGGSLGVAAGRISYSFGFTGPSMIIDTACSSSLVTTHLAIQALRLGECDMAVSSGVNLILGPETHINFCQAHMLAPDGHCKTFSEDADGYARGEGVGSLILKRLSDAERDGDKIYALLLGSAVNQDGPSGGLTVPNGPSQERVIQAALDNARIRPEDVTYIEAHGTGTSLGDPIEVSALTRVFGTRRDKKEKPLYLSSVKTNIGHLESAAGVAGLIKTILAVSKGTIPPHRNLKVPSSHIDWKAFPGEVPLKPILWKSPQRIGGVSSFSFSGTNAHVVVSHYDGLQTSPSTEEANSKDHGRHWIETHPKTRILPISGKTIEHLKLTQSHYLKAMREGSDHNWHDWCTSAARGRTHHAFRSTLIATSIEEAITQLESGLLEISSKKVNSPRIAFQFTGQGAQYLGMGKDLYEENEVFRHHMDECDAICKPILGRSLVSMLYDGTSDEDVERIHATRFTQPVLFSFEYALAQLVMHFGIEPEIMLGHSLGEYVAATLSGIFKLEDALKIVCERGRLMDELCQTGSMLSVSAPLSILQPELEKPEFAGHVALASVNTSTQTVVAGDHQSIAAFADRLTSLEIENKPLQVSHAFHSHLVEPMLDDFKRAFQAVEFGQGSIPIVSNVYGSLATSEQLRSAEYWCEHLRRPVQYLHSIQYVLDKQFDLVIEIGPKPILTALGQQISELSNQKNSPIWISTQRKQTSSWDQLLHIIAILYRMGLDEPLKRLYDQKDRYPVDIPTQSFLKERYWISEEGKARGSQKRPGHPLLGEHIESPALSSGTHLFMQQLSADELGFLAHHRVGGRILLPAAAHTEILYAASKQIFNEPVLLSDLLIMKPLVLTEQGTTSIQTILRVLDESSAELEIYSRTDEQSSWQLNTSALAKRSTHKSPKRLDLDLLSASNQEDHIVASYYEASRALGIEHGETFMALSTLKTGFNTTYGTLELPTKAMEAQGSRFTLHPILLDAAYQLASFALRHAEFPYLPMGAQQIQVYGPLPTKVHCIAEGIIPDEMKQVYTCNLTLADDEGNVLASINQLQFQKTSIRSIGSNEQQIKDWFYQLDWDQSLITTSQAPHLQYPVEKSGNTQNSLRELISSCGFYKDLFESFDLQIERTIVVTFSVMGWNPDVGSETHLDVLETELGIQAEFRALFIRCLEILAEAQYISLSEQRIQVLKPLKSDAPLLLEELISQFPKAKPEIALLYRCLHGLADVLTGSQDPIELLFPDEEASDAAQLYRYSVGSRAINDVLASALADALSDLPAHRKLRILEVGSGTGGTTTSVLPLLPKYQTEYWYTDVSSHFTRLGATQFEEQYPFLRFGILDIEENRSDFKEDTFDIIIAANVLHATRSIGQTLNHCYQRLAPGGLLFLLEASPKQRWLDLTFGMTDGWWRFKGHDGLRDSYPLLDAAGWKECLSKASFQTSSVLGEHEPVVRDGLGQQVIIAKKSINEPQNAVSISWIPFNKMDEATITSSSDVDHLDAIVLQYPSEIGSQFNYDDQYPLFEPLIRLITAVSESSTRKKPRIWVVAPGSIYHGKAELPSPYWTLPGLIRTIRSEYPELNASLIDPGTQEESLLRSIVNQEIESDTPEDLIVYHGQRRYVQRLKNLNDDKQLADLPIDPAATYLISGGYGRMGILSAQFLADRGAKHILLLGRSKPKEEETIDAIRSLEAKGVRIIQTSGDVSDRKVISSLITSSSYPPIRGIIHAAGTLFDATLNTLDKRHLDEVMLPKVKGTTVIHEASLGLELDFFIVYSSIGAVFGPVGQANYAAANTYMDQLIQFRRGQGLPGLSINWGAWSGSGLAQRDQSHSTTTVMNSIQFIDPEDGFKAFGSLMGRQGQVVVVPIDWSKASEYLSNMPLLSTFMTDHTDHQHTISNQEDMLSQMQDLPKQDQINQLIEMVRAYTAKVLGSNVDRIDPTIGFFDMGMDSLTSIELRNALQAATKLNLPTTLIFKYPTVEALAAYLADELFGANEQSDGSGSEVSEPGGVSHQVLGSNKDLTTMSEDELSSLIDDAFKDMMGGDS